MNRNYARVQVTPDYIYHFATTQGDGYVNLTIDSQWLGAKDPNGKQRKININLNEDTLKALLKVLSN